jgi:hypothetical protein
VVWKSSVRLGKSSPVLTEKHLFLTAYADEKLYTQCFDRRTGKLLWEQSVDRRQKPLIHKLNEPAAITPVTDGVNVAFFPAGCFPMTGWKLRWRSRLASQALRGLSNDHVDGGWFCKSISTSMATSQRFCDTGQMLWKTSGRAKAGQHRHHPWRKGDASSRSLTVSWRRS